MSGDGVRGEGAWAGGTWAGGASGRDPLARIRAAVAEFERRSHADEARDSERSAQTAALARDGALGADWKRVQERVDRGETTLADVFTGRDGSPEAAALAKSSRENMAGIVTAAREQGGEPLADELDELGVLRSRVALTLGETPPADGRSGDARPWPTS